MSTSTRNLPIVLIATALVLSPTRSRAQDCNANGIDDALDLLPVEGSIGRVASAHYAVGAGAQAVVAVDLDRNGQPDLVSVNRVASTLSVLGQRDAGLFEVDEHYPTGAGPVDLIAAGINGDGHQDIVTADARGGTVSVLFNGGPGWFSSPVSVSLGAVESLSTSRREISIRTETSTSSARPGDRAMSRCWSTTAGAISKSSLASRFRRHLWRSCSRTSTRTAISTW